MGTFPEFRGFQKIYRYSRDCIITEKIDGTNGVIFIDENNNIFAGSRSRWLWGSIQDEIHNDNHGFAQWVKINKDELLKLGKGYHFGEWWGCGIQRNYGLKEKRFSLFNISIWRDDAIRPKCCEIVPILFEGEFITDNIVKTMKDLQTFGSVASIGFMKPEGVVIFHTQSNYLFKKTFEKDQEGKHDNQNSIQR
jgi:hypothetical protein